MNAEEFITFVEDRITPLDEAQKERFRAMGPLYEDWNSKINVISRKDIGNLYEHHILHSLAIAAYLVSAPQLQERFASSSILDLGTGGGFPGIPLAIVYPGASFTLCDSVGKKTKVASEVVSALGLSNVQVVNARAESLKEKFNFVVSRAVATLTDFYPWVRGKFTDGILYLRGGDVAEETAMLQGRFSLRRGSIRVFPVNRVFRDEYFDGKYVIHIEK